LLIAQCAASSSVSRLKDFYGRITIQPLVTSAISENPMISLATCIIALLVTASASWLAYELVIQYGRINRRYIMRRIRRFTK
jgi:hypothetical protein